MKHLRLGPLVGFSYLVLFLSMSPRTVASAEAQGINNSLTRPSTTGCPWLNQSLSISQRVHMLLPRLTLSDKLSLVHGVWPGEGYSGYVRGIPSLCIPALKLQDGPAGVADGAHAVTALPAPVAGAATWDPRLMYEYGTVIGEEAKAKGINVLFGPMVNIVRDPRWGRAWETFGEDPYLNGKIGASVVEGIQSQDVIATVKHVAAYDQDQNSRGDSIVGVRALHEIYLPAFHRAIASGNAGAVMTTGGYVNNLPANESSYLLMDTLEKRWKFKGIVMSDYDGARSAAGSANAGLDLSMPKAGNFGAPLYQAVQSEQVPIARLNDMVSSLLRQEFRFGLFDHPNTGSMQAVATSSSHVALATSVAEQGTVLLKNSENQLPLSPQKVRSIAVIGASGSAYPKAVGCGSGQVDPPYIVSPLQGIKERVGPGVIVTYAQGSNPPDAPNPVASSMLIADAVAAAKKSNVAIVFADDLECEGGGKAYGPAAPPAGSVNDRPSIALSGDQNELITAVATANPHTIVVLNTGAPVAAPWLSSISALLEAWYPGQVDGSAIASVLFGDVDPSGHTTQTWPLNEQQMPTANPVLWPGVGPTQKFSNGILVGYRYYDARHITPLFPFGYGLSYTTFSYSHLEVKVRGANQSVSAPVVTPCNCNTQNDRLVEVTATVTNTGKRAGADVAQLYLGDPAEAAEPPRQLKGFEKVFLQPGQSTTVHFTLTGDDLSYWNNQVDGWVIPKGVFEVFVGDSSSLANLPLRSTFTVTRLIEAKSDSKNVENSSPLSPTDGQ